MTDYGASLLLNVQTIFSHDIAPSRSLQILKRRMAITATQQSQKVETIILAKLGMTFVYIICYVDL